MSVSGPNLGPCESWIDGDAVAACCSASTGTDAAVYDDVAVEASMLMYELSGRQFSGLCERTVRPCRSKCSCFGQTSLGLGPWYWNAASAGLAGGLWRNECGDRCGCGTESYVKLAGYPVREVLEIKIDGAIVDPSEYRLDGWRKVIRMADPGPPVVNRSWPACQNLALDDDQPGTFAISYRHGVDPPQLGRDAAVAFACELYKLCNPGNGDCKLPTKVKQIVRQGVTIDRVTSIAAQLREGSTGIPQIDAFIAGYNPTGMRRRPAVFSPDLPSYPRQVGT